ncbi:LOW QUALITY PROTEIN: ras-related protein Rab-26-like [Ylistrum balloti]|uniref:LOW QUALITY PROTEIN: ras-related protein Rab-26-like n=1 Tax=Ylistrum balloti TaxID=509963 RepID=UPI002905CFFE|nr:LOW QUALITY PROTEIN: ras-related protein Rab-26-like [Ylistrum balloti]
MATERVSERTIKCKVVVVGDLSVGKTLLVNTFVNREDQDDLSKSSQFSSSSKGFPSRTGYASKATTFISTESKVVKLDIWDTAATSKCLLCFSKLLRFPVPCLLPLDSVVDRWNTFGNEMALFFHSLVNDITVEKHHSNVLFHQPSDGQKSQRQNNIHFSQILFTDENSKRDFSRNIATKQQTGDIRHRQWREAEDMKFLSLNKSHHTNNTLITENIGLNNKGSAPKEPYVELKVKVIFLGSSGVGKTAMFETFENEGCDYTQVRQRQNNLVRTSNASLPRKASYNSDVKRVNGKVKMTVCDTAGQERYRSLTSSYYRGTHGCLILFDVTKGHTFDSVQSWYNDLQAYCTSPEMISTILVGNNCDAEEREVPREKAEKLAEHIGIPYMEVRSDNTHTVNGVFETLADMIIDKYKLHPSLNTESTSTMLPRPSKKPSTWCFC